VQAGQVTSNAFVATTQIEKVIRKSSNCDQMFDPRQCQKYDYAKKISGILLISVVKCLVVPSIKHILLILHLF